MLIRFHLGVILAALAIPSASGSGPGPDAVLEDLLARAEASSPVLARARAAVHDGRAGVLMARTPYRPTVGAQERVTRTDNAPAAFALTLDQGRFTPTLIEEINDPTAVTDWATSLYARWVLHDFGLRRAHLDAARAESDRRDLLLEAAARDVRFRVSAAYYDLRRARASVILWEDTVRLFEAHEAMTRARHEAGAVLRSDVLSIAVRLAEAKENLIAARSDAHVGVISLAAEVGVSWRGIDVPEGPVEAPVYDRDEEGVAEQARATHPELAAIDAGQRAAHHAERAAGRISRPSLVGEIRGLWHGDDEAFGLDRDSYQATVLIDIPLFDGGRASAARAQAAARREDLEASRRALSDALDLAARSGHRRAEEAVARIGIADAAAAAAGEALAIIEERYRAGLATIVDLIEVERALTEARVRAIEARALAWKAIAQVDRVAGEREPR